jgi:spore maturation protein CgeB
MPFAWYGYGHNKLSKSSALSRCFRGEAWGIAMYRIFAASRMTLNCHIDIATMLGGNLRLFEATGVGTCVVTDWKSNLRDFFEPDSEIVAYQSKDELLEKIRFLLSHPEERQRIAQAGQARTLRDHTYERRMPELAALLKGYLR